MNYEEERSNHFKRIRTDPIYRMNGMLQDMQDNAMPGMFVTSQETVTPDNFLLERVNQLELKYNQLMRKRSTKATHFKEPF